jgi:hypothetical protein
MGKKKQADIPVGLIALLLIALGAAFPYFEEARNANEVPRLMQGIALVDAGGWAIDGREMRGLDHGPDVSRNPKTGHLYPNKAPGASLVAAVAYVGGQTIDSAFDRDFTLRSYTFWARILGSLFPTLLLCLFAFRRHRDLQGKTAISVALLLYALATPAASYAHLFYGHQLAACLLFIGISFCADGIESKDAKVAALGGVAAGAAVAVEYGAVFAGVPIGVGLLLGLRHSEGARPLVGGLVAALVPIGLLAAYHQAAFGSPFSTGYHNVVNETFAAKHGVGMLGLSWPTMEGFHVHVLAHESGLLWWSPVVVFALWGLIELALSSGSRRTEARLHLGVFLTILVVGTGLSFEGGWRVGPRYLVVALPSLIIGFCHAFGRVRQNPISLGIFVAVASWSVLVNALAANLWPHFDLTNINSPLAEVALPLLSDGFAPYGLMWKLGMPGSAWLPILASGLGLVLYVARDIPRTTLSTAALAVGVAVGVLAVWVLPGTFEPHEVGPRNLKYIEKVYEPRQGEYEARKSRRLDIPVVVINADG